MGDDNAPGARRWQWRAGAHYCPEHAVVRPVAGLVPSCPRCGRAVHVGARVGKELTTVEPVPATCAGLDRHRLEPGAVLLGTRACSCAPDGMHRTWTCAVCGDVQQWPPHDADAVAPYFGPGAQSSRSMGGGSGQSG
ncbi:hypothetical protein [Micromonospora sp. NPDC005652]|uniref:hypothetical protein n=1 Tax=Micromonospora sp. NPDC005652 TaxID=3157046 RepID=UPI003404F9AC